MEGLSALTISVNKCGPCFFSTVDPCQSSVFVSGCPCELSGLPKVEAENGRSKDTWVHLATPRERPFK